MKTVSITDKELINGMPRCVYENPVYVVEVMSRVRAAVAVLKRAAIVGFDTETRPNFRRSDHHKIALIQLATKYECFLFRTCAIGIPDILKNYLEDSSCVKVGLSLHDDFNSIRRLCPSFEPGGFIEIQDVVKQYDISDLSLQKIYAILFGKHISKSKQLSNWEADKLSVGQQQYAAIDAYSCIEIYEHLTSGAFIPEQSPYYHDIADDSNSNQSFT